MSAREDAGWSATAMGGFHPCNCIGPQRGEPKCPCMMRGVIQRDGRWIEPERDLGPVNATSDAVREALSRALPQSTATEKGEG